jgi:hypothetical protein
MPATERVTVTLPAETVSEIDRLEQNRSKFILEAVRRELQRRRRRELQRSLASPHPEGAELADMGVSQWAERLPAEDIAELVDLKAGKSVRWIEGQGWVEVEP